MARTMREIFGITELKCLKDYSGKEKTRLSKRYAALVEKYPAHDKKIWLAKDNGEVLLSIYARQLNPAVSGKDAEDLHPELAAGACRSLDLLGRLIEERPECTELYVSVFESLGTRKDRESIIPIIRSSLDLMEKFEFENEERTDARLYMVSTSIERAVAVISVLNKYDINCLENSKLVQLYEKIGGEYVRSRPSQEELVRIYLSRGLTAMGGNCSVENVNLIISFFEKIDSYLVKAVEDEEIEHAYKKAYVEQFLKLNEKMADLIGKRKISIEQLEKRLEIGGLEAMERTVGKEEDDFDLFIY